MTNLISERRTANQTRQENRELRQQIKALRAHVELLRQELDPVHLNSAGNLPPVACPLLIEIAPGRLVRAERPTAVANRGDDLTYQLTDGNVIHGKLRWTYP